MKIRCPKKCVSSDRGPKLSKFGHYYRSSDRKWIQRFQCALCKTHFSTSTLTKCYKQKKRQLNRKIFIQLVSGVSQRQTARILGIQQSTVARKLTFLGERCRILNHRVRKRKCGMKVIQFDDMETFEHTKLKPLSITLAVEKCSRHILGFEVSRMSAKGFLAKRSLKKYGYRQDERSASRDRLFRRIKSQISNDAIIESDDSPHYPPDVSKHFPFCEHRTYLGERGAITGQGELKKVTFDPLFCLNHTCAMFRAHVSRLIRKTWNTTKKIQPLVDHLEIYAWYHNQTLLN